jgi:hypothetical protein
MKRICEGLTYGFSVAGCYGLATEWTTTEKSITWWILFLFLTLITHFSIKFAIGDLKWD